MRRLDQLRQRRTANIGPDERLERGKTFDIFVLALTASARSIRLRINDRQAQATFHPRLSPQPPLVFSAGFQT